jgi:RNase P subunit RPR2
MTLKKPYKAECDGCDRIVVRRLPTNANTTLQNVWVKCKECGTPLPADSR